MLPFMSQVVHVAVQVPGCACCCSSPRLCVLLFKSQVVCVAVHVVLAGVKWGWGGGWGGDSEVPP